VGAKTLTLWQACIIASVFEFTGAVALGGEVAKTIAGAITSPDYFQNYPEVSALQVHIYILADVYVG
jgi:sodium-dependent phosphate transporter